MRKAFFQSGPPFWYAPVFGGGILSVRLGDGALLFEEARETHEEAVLTLFDVGDAL